MSLTPLLADPALARAALDRGEVGVVELTRAALDRAAQMQPAIGAFSELTHEFALEHAERVQESLRSGAARGPLAGLPLGVKDVIDVAGVPTRLGTPRAGHRIPAASAPVCSALAAAGAVIVGKTATHELAYGMTTPAARNPRDPSRIPGGSSGGSAAAVGAGITALALGTDTNGSIRAPAAHCGVVGLKPTRGALSREGVAELAWTQDTVGLLTPDVATAVHAWAALSPGPEAERREWRVGVDHGVIGQAAPDVAAAVGSAFEQLELTLVEVRLPDVRLAGSASVLAIMAEAALAWREELSADPEGFGPAVRAALTAGAEVGQTAYLHAKRARVRVCARVRELFERERLDAIALPTVPVTPTPAGVERVTVNGRERAVESLQSEFTSLASLTGQPALSLPCGAGEAGLPVGLQLLGRAHREAELLALAADAEAAIPALPRFV
ncbi:MAG TPA: amidase [Thermoleophilaceae bacterium]|jgi:aspartyl-tRNA(Asn)/glutamyl-tRNA(Gln) amidotransferase subunit A